MATRRPQTTAQDRLYKLIEDYERVKKIRAEPAYRAIDKEAAKAPTADEVDYMGSAMSKAASKIGTLDGKEAGSTYEPFPKQPPAKGPAGIDKSVADYLVQLGKGELIQEGQFFKAGQAKADRISEEEERERDRQAQKERDKVKAAAAATAEDRRERQFQLEQEAGKYEKGAMSKGKNKKPSAKIASDLGDYEAAVNIMHDVRKMYDEKASAFGSGIKSIWPASDAASYNNYRTGAAQLVGSTLEGGKLTDPDFIKYYEKLMPDPWDHDTIAHEKVENLLRLLAISKKGKLNGLAKSGIDVSDFLADYRDVAPDFNMAPKDELGRVSLKILYAGKNKSLQGQEGKTIKLTPAQVTTYMNKYPGYFEVIYGAKK